MTPKAPLWLLTLITFSGTFAMHIFVPALPEAAQDLHASTSAMQMTMSVYIFGLAVGQLVYGPLSDRFGRRPVLMGGLVLYTAMSIAAIFVLDVDKLIAVRLFQALGGCSGLVLGRAIVRDTALPTDAARRLAVMNLMITIGPGIAPLVGGALASTSGWRSIFILLSALGITNLVFTWRLLPETLATRSNTGIRMLARSYRQLLASPAFLGYAVGGGCATTAMYAFIASSPFIFVHQLHRPDYEVGIYLAILVSGIWLGSFLATRLIVRVPMDRLMVTANLLSVAGSLVILGAVLSSHLSVVLAVGSMFFFCIGAGLTSPAAVTQAMGVNPHIIGSAAGFYGFAQMGVGAICTAAAGIGGNPSLATAIVLTAAGVIGQIAFWTAQHFRPIERPVPAL